MYKGKILINRCGWRYHPKGIPADQTRDGEQDLPQYKMFASGFPESPYGVERMRFEADNPISKLVKTVPHVAFEVDDIDEALKGKRVFSAPGYPSAGLRASMIIDNEFPIELIEFTRTEQTEMSRAPANKRWSHYLETFKKRLKVPEEKAAKEGIVYTEEQIIALERRRQEREESLEEIETEYPDYLVAQDTYYVGYFNELLPAGICGSGCGFLGLSQIPSSSSLRRKIINILTL